MSNIAPTLLGSFIVDLRINGTLTIGEVENLAYRGAKAVRKPHLPGIESVYLFLEFTIVFGFLPT